MEYIVIIGKVVFIFFSLFLMLKGYGEEDTNMILCSIWFLLMGLN